MKSVTLTLRLTCTEPTADNDTAVEMALDRLGHPHFAKSVVSMLHDAGFTVALPIDSEVRDCEFRPELGDERFELDGSDRFAGCTHIHTITGELVSVTGHVNGITIFDTEDEEGEELLDEVFAEQYEPIYRATHRSRKDGSDAMLVEVSPNGQNLKLRNECGDEWQDSINEWEVIA